MRSKLRSSLSYANVSATCALVLALGGTSYAAMTLPRNSVGAVQIKRGAVTSGKVQDRSLLARDFKSGQLPRGPRGERGPAGDRGPHGPAGTPDTSAFFTKAESDGRFVRGSGSVTPIPVVDIPNNGSATLVEVPGVGKLEAQGCGILNIALRYTNSSAGSQDWVVLAKYHVRVNVPPDSGTVAAGGTLNNAHNDSRDIVRLSVSGPRPTMFEVTQTRTANDHCLLWGEVVSAS